MRYAIILSIFLLAVETHAQLKVRSVDAGPVYNSGLFLKSTFHKVSGPGALANVRMQISRRFDLMFTIGYNDLNIKQEDPIKNWDWGFYNQSYSRLISAQLKDTTYRAEFVPNQRLYIIPIEIVLLGELLTLDRLRLSFGVGGGLQLYQRHLWVREYWSRYYPDYQYTYRYDYNNDAGVKEGTMYTVKALVQVEYKFSNRFGAAFSISAVDFLGAQNLNAYDNFPLKAFVSAGLSLTFYY